MYGKVIVMGQNDAQGMEKVGQIQRMSIALTIGATIGVIGLVLLLYGLFCQVDYRCSDGINVNLWWGILMLVFVAIMSIGGYISSKRQRTH
jgi:hypothetical protein